MNKKNLFLIIGPSGSGKTTIIKNVAKKHGLKVATSYTTRKMRPEDEDGFDHFFISEEEFRELTNLQVKHTIGQDQYGITEEEIEKSDIFIVDPYGADYIRTHWGEKRKIVVIALFVDADTCLKRMIDRGDTSFTANTRVINDDLPFRNLEQRCNIVLDAGLPREVLAELIWPCMQAYM